MKTKEEQRQFIINTLLPYKLNPETRAIEGMNCVYLTSCGKQCAVGKHMKDGDWQNEVDLGYNELIDKYQKEDFLTEEALSMNFSDDVWLNIQQYHDNDKIRKFISINLEQELKINLKELYD